MALKPPAESGQAALQKVSLLGKGSSAQARSVPARQCGEQRSSWRGTAEQRWSESDAEAGRDRSGGQQRARSRGSRFDSRLCSGACRGHGWQSLAYWLAARALGSRKITTSGIPGCTACVACG